MRKKNDDAACEGAAWGGEMLASWTWRLHDLRRTCATGMEDAGCGGLFEVGRPGPSPPRAPGARRFSPVVVFRARFASCF